MPRPVPPGLAAALVMLAGTASAQTFGNVVTFGDSLSDSGNFAAHLRSLGHTVPPGNSFTTNPDPVAAEIIAETFGASGASSADGGPNHAWGGACVFRGVGNDKQCGEPDDVAGGANIGAQITRHLTALDRDMRADPDALYNLWGGANDIRGILTDLQLGAITGQAELGRELVLVAGASARIAGDLLDRGARHVVVYNMPDIGRTPAFVGTPLAANVSGMARIHNQALNEGLGGLGPGIVAIDVAGLFDEVIDNPQRYGILNATGTACRHPSNPSARVTSALCLPADTPNWPQFVFPEGADRTHIFADTLHPTGVAHEMVANTVLATLAAPVQVSLAGEAGIEMAAAHRGDVAAERTADAGSERPTGSWRAFARGSIGRNKHKPPTGLRLGDVEANLRTVTIGVSQRIADDIHWGVAGTFGSHDNGAAGADLDGSAVIGSVFGVWRHDGLYLGGSLGGGTVSVEIERSIRLRSETDIAPRTERGDTRARQFGAGIDAGYVMRSDRFSHGPFAGLAWVDQKVDAYREDGMSATAMNFSAFDRDSVAGSVGYRLSAAVGPDRRFRARARVSAEREFRDGPIAVTAGSNTLNGRFALDGYAPARDRFGVELGLGGRLDGGVAGDVGYAGRFGRDSRSDHMFRAALSVAF